MDLLSRIAFGLELQDYIDACSSCIINKEDLNDCNNCMSITKQAQRRLKELANLDCPLSFKLLTGSFLNGHNC